MSVVEETTVTFIVLNNKNGGEVCVPYTDSCIAYLTSAAAVGEIDAKVIGQFRRSWFPYEDEGVMWIRGHHAAGSVEAQALLASYLITQGT